MSRILLLPANANGLCDPEPYGGSVPCMRRLVCPPGTRDEGSAIINWEPNEGHRPSGANWRFALALVVDNQVLSLAWWRAFSILYPTALKLERSVIYAMNLENANLLADRGAGKGLWLVDRTRPSLGPRVCRAG